MPVLTPEQLGEISVKLEKLTRSFEEKLLEDIARRIAKAGTITDTAEWQIIRLKEMGYANEFIKKALAEYTQKSKEEINQLFFDAGQCSDEFYSKVYAAAGKDFLPLEKNPEMLQFVEAGIAQTKGELKNFTRSMGFSVKQPDGTTAFKPIAKAYQDALDLAQMQVSTGVFDYNTAIRNATKTLCDGGLEFVDYASGHVNHADVAVRRAVLTGVSQMTGKISEHNTEELETDIVEVTAHAGARPDHAEWQGRWYSLSGKSKKYPSLVEVTGYGTGAGLKGWNCRHDFYPVIDGVSVPTYTEEELKNIDPPPIEYGGKTYTYYECTQRQRRIETAMRKTKRQIISAKGAGDEDMFTAKSILLRRQKEEYEKFSKAAGLLTQNERTQVYGFDRSVAAKSSWAARKATAPKSAKTSKGSSSGSGGHAVTVNIPTPHTNGGKGKLYRDESLTNSKNGGIINTGLTSGALNPYSEKAQKHAVQYYESVRHMKTDTQKISAATGIKKDKIDKIKNHVFIQEHDLIEGKKRFDPSYDMAQSWQRLINGNFEEKDIVLLKHEYAELRYMEKGYTQNEAHIKASKKYNYAKYCE